MVLGDTWRKTESPFWISELLFIASLINCVLFSCTRFGDVQKFENVSDRDTCSNDAVENTGFTRSTTVMIYSFKYNHIGSRYFHVTQRERERQWVHVSFLVCVLDLWLKSQRLFFSVKWEKSWSNLRYS